MFSAGFTNVDAVFDTIVGSGPLARTSFLFNFSLSSEGLRKARSTPATMSKQHCRMLQCRMLLRHCCFFLATMSKQRSTLLPKTATMSNEFCVEISSFRQSRMLLRQCCPKRQHCRSNRQQSCLLLRQCCFDIVASVDRALKSKSTKSTKCTKSTA